jgi:hypothetical protein
MTRKTLIRSTSSSLLLFVLGCEMFSSPDFNYIQADITEITKQTSTSVNVKFDVFSSGNADDCHFWLVCDSVPVSVATDNARRHLIVQSYYGCVLGGVSDITVEGIVPGKKYFYQLAEWGNWDVSGQTSSIVVMVGTQHEYTLAK